MVLREMAAAELQAEGVRRLKGAPAGRQRRESPSPPALPPDTLRHTEGVCSTCLTRVPAVVRVTDGEVRLEKHCALHGITFQRLSLHPRYWRELDRFYFDVNGDPYPQRDFIVRMTERCNLDCPICLARANTQETPDLDIRGLEKLLSARRGIKIDLMAAEPTLREDLETWIRRVKQSGNVAALHTNGIRLADFHYARRIRDAGIDEVFLQFDGFDEAAHVRLRGRPLVKTRLAALENLRRLGIATSLIVVIAKGVNEAQVSPTFRFALQPENDHIREVFFMGLRLLGSARDVRKEDDNTLESQQLMPDELIDLLCAQEPELSREDIHRFNLLYFALLSAFRVKKCLYIQHYLVTREPRGEFLPISRTLDLEALAQAARRYGQQVGAHPHLARARLAASIVRQGLRPTARQLAGDLLRLERVFQQGMNLQQVPRRFLLLGFITACDPDNFDAQVAINCGKGELSVDGGCVESSAEANVAREMRVE